MTAAEAAARVRRSPAASDLTRAAGAVARATRSLAQAVAPLVKASAFIACAWGSIVLAHAALSPLP